MQITSLDFSAFTDVLQLEGFRGDLEVGKDYSLCTASGNKKVRIKELHVFIGLGKEKVEKVRSGDICAIVGIEGFEIGDTVADLENPEALARIKVMNQHEYVVYN